ncbi:MAG: hypothetical protein HQ488_03790 [Parcubacteria group bacterium]|nr:hypothetical protein [Parcubacteria group bacterium]
MAKSKQSSYYLYGAAAIVAVGLIIFAANNSASTSGPSIYDEFAQCVTDTGTLMYGAWWCPHCNDQKEAFGSAFDLIDYIECSNASKTMTQECRDLGIEGYPTWEFSDSSRSGGFMTLEAISAKTGCELPQEGV